MPMIGIDEASNEEEQSPEPRKNGLGVISEETGGYVFPKVKDTKELSISKFLDTLQIHQVFPSEVNMIRLKFMSQHDIPVPKLSLRNNKLLIKRKSDKLITLSGLM
uniref:Uncharacterized protein n=1 Tax=Euplotes crassus TaxID=5936 RepID=A0A7S3KKH2_EUPCR|mmetsp:Transcript_28837/g.28544  ORF Transcript_28837/g.28544 Transcript_28837/m.28544 type:complete len:106 (+) Transcript_28837:315-632(+)|eukprot:CAMPEP_0197004806 /NCGR_PEP_ID=MMETSP1380-20130617/25731_1 /TAXON_ID=5936 /ORGANISM="Euplotes crassus, Strain CT5" /LENGTH=105 /DNA_ID=CAMNT_0042423721 /DNA_START=315 /DNA_END=632 /DNA_ORIENTATION=+